MGGSYPPIMQVSKLGAEKFAVAIAWRMGVGSQIGCVREAEFISGANRGFISGRCSGLAQEMEGFNSCKCGSYSGKRDGAGWGWVVMFSSLL